MLINNILTELEKVAQDFDYSSQAADFIIKKFKDTEEHQAPDSNDPSQRQKLFWEHESGIAL